MKNIRIRNMKSIKIPEIKLNNPLYCLNNFDDAKNYIFAPYRLKSCRSGQKGDQYVYGDKIFVIVEKDENNNIISCKHLGYSIHPSVWREYSHLDCSNIWLICLYSKGCKKHEVDGEVIYDHVNGEEPIYEIPMNLACFIRNTRS